MDASGPTLLAVAPTRRELVGAPYGETSARTGVVGIGRPAGPQTAALLAAAPCGMLLSLGFAGALDADLRPGDVVVGSAVLHGSLQPLATGADAPRAATLLREGGVAALEGAVLTVDEPLLSPQAKRRAAEESGALVVDMEARWIAEAAAAHGAPVVVLRVVLDEADFALPEFVAAIIADDGRREWTHAVRALRSPSAARSLPPLFLRTRKAGRALRRAASRILPALAAQL